MIITRKENGKANIIRLNSNYCKNKIALENSLEVYNEKYLSRKFVSTMEQKHPLLSFPVAQFLWPITNPWYE